MKVSKQAGRMLAAMLGASIALSSCGGLGEGILPVDAKIQPFGGLEGAATTKAYACINTGLTFLLDFSNGSRGDFTSRATYSSSNPAVAKVSNLDIPVPETSNSFYNRGTIIPVAQGSAVITAQYLSFTRSIEVTVEPAQNFKIEPASANVATGSLQDLSVSADLDGVTTSLDSVVLWAFDTPNDAVATISASTGTITGVAPGTGLVARARIPGCDQLTAQAPVEVSNLQSLALSREFGANEQLIVGTSERLIATGTLDNGQTQDLSRQVKYTSSDASFISFFTGTLTHIAVALQANASPIQISATFGADATAVTAPSINITPVTDVLNSISVTPASADVKAGGTAQFRAIGNYASGTTQELTRHVGWSSSNTSLAIVQSSSSAGINELAGLASTGNSGAGNAVTVTATATNGAGTSSTATATLNIN
jgi:hypothetical protein